MRWLLVAVAALTGCNLEVGPANDWIPIAELEGELAAASGPVPAAMPASDGTATAPIRIVSYNVAGGQKADEIGDAVRARPELVAASIVLVQELESYPEESLSRTERLAEALDMGWVYVPARPKEGGTHGLAFLSRYPLRNVMSMELPHVEGGHRRTAIRADVDIDGQLLRVVNVHLDTVINITDRILQLRPAVIDAPATVVVGGDFNTNPYTWQEGYPNAPAAVIGDSDQARLLDDYMSALDFTPATAELGPTEEMYGVRSRLDSIYVRGLDGGEGGVVRDIDLSDHWPLWLDVTRR
jgi:endonuclease/exonuclease/phosphatase family metal-dependent hydrolase